MRAEAQLGKRSEFYGRKLDANKPCANERYYSWAESMRRLFVIDVLECPRCPGPMKALARIRSPDTTRKILQCLGLPARPPPIAMARPDPQESLPFDCDEAARLD